MNNPRTDHPSNTSNMGEISDGCFLELFGSYTIFGLSIYKWFLIGGATIFIYKTVIHKYIERLKVYGLYEEKRKNASKSIGTD